MISVLQFFLGIAFIVLMGVVTVTLVERHIRLVWVIFGIAMIPYVLMCLDMIGVL